MQIEDINLGDYPDLVDAHCMYAEYENGTPLDADQLDALNDSDVVYNKALEIASGA